MSKGLFSVAWRFKVKVIGHGLQSNLLVVTIVVCFVRKPCYFIFETLCQKVRFAWRNEKFFQSGKGRGVFNM